MQYHQPPKAKYDKLSAIDVDGEKEWIVVSCFCFYLFSCKLWAWWSFMIDSVRSFYGFALGELCVVYFCCMIVFVWTSIEDRASVELKYKEPLDCEAAKYFWRFLLCWVAMLWCCKVCVKWKGWMPDCGSCSFSGWGYAIFIAQCTS